MKGHQQALWLWEGKIIEAKKRRAAGMFCDKYSSDCQLS